MHGSCGAMPRRSTCCPLSDSLPGSRWAMMPRMPRDGLWPLPGGFESKDSRLWSRRLWISLSSLVITRSRSGATTLKIALRLLSPGVLVSFFGSCIACPNHRSSYRFTSRCSAWAPR